MTEPERQNVLAHNARLATALRAACREIERLRDANANLRVERDAADVLLGEAMDAVMGR
jgi:hypothetical protein